jgi:(p)ppGpp synthase/HD superfamily hydrolase
MTPAHAIDAARAFAYAAHIGQQYGSGHYVTHLDHAVDVLRRFNLDTDYTEVYGATYLHDTIEDTAVTFHDISTIFGPRVAYLVDAVTDQPGENRKERHARTYPRIRAAGQNGLLVKLADRIANVETSVRGPNEKKLAMYKKEYREFREALFSKEHSFIVLRMWEHLDNLLGWEAK